MTSWSNQIGFIGEQAVKSELENLGWSVQDLNATANFPNVDLFAQKAQKSRCIQVKTHTRYGWILAGSVNAKVCSGAVSILTGLFRRTSPQFKKLP